MDKLDILHDWWQLLRGCVRESERVGLSELVLKIQAGSAMEVCPQVWGRDGEGKRENMNMKECPVSGQAWLGNLVRKGRYKEGKEKLRLSELNLNSGK